MTDPAIITVAITGSLPTKADNPAVPISSSEQIEASHEAFEAGAAVAHIHVRNEDGSAGSDPEQFRRVQDGIHRHCPNMIVQFTTSGRGRSHSDRGLSLTLKPDMASLSTGTVNFRTIIYENPPDVIEALASTMINSGIKPEIEIFDLSMLYAASALADRGLLARPFHVQFVLGMPGALPFKRQVFDFLLSELKATEPDATWGVMGIGANQLVANQWALTEGGHLRTGFEDNVRWDKTRLAVNNAELVSRAADLCQSYGRSVASTAQARHILSMPQAGVTT